jgi:hypothetical protein
MKKKQKSIKTPKNNFEEGYEDPEEKQLKEAKKRLEEMEKPFNPLDIITMRNIIIFFIWSIIYKLFIDFGFGLIYFFLTIIILIFNNLGERKPWELSAYSIFNPNFERIPGSINSENFNGMGILNIGNNNNNLIQDNIDRLNNFNNEIENELNRKIQYDTKSENKKRKLKEIAKQSLNSLCYCGSGKKYKNCCLKKEE